MGIAVTFMRMESRKRRRSFFMMMTILLLIVEDVKCILVMGPPGAVNAVPGSTVTLPCYTNLSLPVYWQFDPVGGEAEWMDIYRGNPGEIVDWCRPKYTVQVDSTENQYNLTIVNIQAQDAGTYRCSDDSGLSLWLREEGHVFYTEVFVEAASVTLAVASNSAAWIVLSVILGLIGVLLGVATITILLLRKTGHRITCRHVIKLYRGDIQLINVRNESDDPGLEEQLISSTKPHTDNENLVSDVECLVKSTVNGIRLQEINATSQQELDELKIQIDSILQQCLKADTKFESNDIKMNNLQEELVVLREQITEIQENSRIDESALENQEISENISLSEQLQMNLPPQSAELNTNSQFLNLTQKLQELYSLIINRNQNQNTSELVGLTRKLENVKSELRQKETELNDSLNTIRQRDEELTNATRHINELICSTQKMVTDITNVEILLEASEQKLIEYQTLMDIRDKELGTLRDLIEQYENELKTYQDKLSKAKDKIDKEYKTRENFEKQETRIRRMQESLNKMTDEKKVLQAKVKEYSELKDNLIKCEGIPETNI